MKQTIYIYANPWFDARFKCGISRLYQIFSRQCGFNLKIIDEEFLRKNIPAGDCSDILVIAGGDGTLHRAINTIPDNILEKYLFGIMPGGTANEFAKSLGLPLILEEAALAITRQKSITRRKIGIINKEYRFATGFLYGIACHILRETSEITKFYLGEYAYPLPGLFAISNYSDFIKKFWINSLEFRTAYLLINNASLRSKNIPADSIKSEDKNLFSFIYLYSEISFGDLTRLMLKNQAGNNILEDPAIFYKPKGDIKLEFEGTLEFMLDGEFYKMPSPLEFEHSEYKIRVIV